MDYSFDRSAARSKPRPNYIRVAALTFLLLGFTAYLFTFNRNYLVWRWRSRNLTPAEIGARNRYRQISTGLVDTENATALLVTALAWQKSHPDDPSSWCYEGTARYLAGDLLGSVRAYGVYRQKDPAFGPDMDGMVAKCQRILARWPASATAKVVLVQAPSEKIRSNLRAEAHKLLADKNYDAIDARASQLIASRYSAPNGNWYLDTFVRAVGNPDSDHPTTAAWAKNQAALTAWRQARPHSPMALAALADSFFEAAWVARGEGYADSVSSEAWKNAIINTGHCDALLRAAKPFLAKNPYFYLLWLDNARLKTPSRQEYDRWLAAAGTAFPDYYRYGFETDTYLMPRWYGKPGEWQKFCTSSADKMGGERGDVYYVRSLWHQWQQFGSEEISFQHGLSWQRTERGFKALMRRYPGDLEVASQYCYFATLAGHPDTAQNLLVTTIRSRAVSSLYTKAGNFGNFRNDLLAR